MLAPDERNLLSDLLAPPSEDFKLEHALATTFTLDLTALLPVMLGFAGADASAESDPMAVLQSVRSYADRVDVYCQAGCVSVPSQHSPMLEFLADTVHQVEAPPGGLFHPKLWVLRFKSESGDEIYRFICGSRNLTHDRSWDTVLTLEGPRRGRVNGTNKDLANFLTSLGGRVPAGIDSDRQDRVDELIEGLRFVHWERPIGLAEKDWLKFHIFGPGKRKKPNMQGHTRLIISPFVNEDGLQIVWPELSGTCTIVSRPEELNKLEDDFYDERVQPTASVLTINDYAAVPPIESSEIEQRWTLTGLHSKLYVVQRGRRANLLLGSANATEQGWKANDEILVELAGFPSRFGVAQFVGDDAPLREILVDYGRSDITEDEVETELRKTLQNILRQLAAMTFVAKVDKSGSLLSLTSDETVTSEAPASLDLKLSLRPFTLPTERQCVVVGKRVSCEWKLKRPEAVTPFFELRASGRSGRNRQEQSCVVMARLEGAAEDRLDKILANQFDTPDKLMRFILLLLEFGDHGEHVATPSSDRLSGGSGSGAWSLGAGAGLLESVLEAISRSPQTIDDIDRLATNLKTTDEGRALLPDEWDEFWQQVMNARDQLQEAKKK